MRMILSVVNIVLLNFALIHHASASEQSWEYKDWSVSSQNELVRYITNGDVVHGHQFGFIKNGRKLRPRSVMDYLVNNQARTTGA